MHAHVCVVAVALYYAHICVSVAVFAFDPRATCQKSPISLPEYDKAFRQRPLGLDYHTPRKAAVPIINRHGEVSAYMPVAQSSPKRMYAVQTEGVIEIL